MGALSTLLVLLLFLGSGCVMLEQSPLPGGLEEALGEGRDFPPGFEAPVSNETGLPVKGWGGGGGGVTRTPVIFVHGNTVSAEFWRPVREYFLQKGYRPDELWALSYGFDTARHFDSNDLSVPTLDEFVTAVLRYLDKRGTGPVHQVDVIGHSLGVTLVRQWMKQTNKYHLVRSFVAANGANHGVWVGRADAWGENRTSAFELHPGSPWLEQLNRGGEAPGPTRTMTLYDGTGWADVLFPPWEKESPALRGAKNLAYNVVHGTWYDHLQLPREPDSMDAILEFLSGDRLPPRNAEPPSLELTRGDGKTMLWAIPEQSRVHCASGSDLPVRDSAGAAALTLSPDTLYTCFALDPATGLASPIERFRVPAQESQSVRPALEVSASPVAGLYAEPVFVTLKASEPDATIVYTTGGGVPSSGSALYEKPIYLPASVTLRAIAITPDGRQSSLLAERYEVSLSYQDALFTLERQLDPTRPIEHSWYQRLTREP